MDLKLIINLCISLFIILLTMHITPNFNSCKDMFINIIVRFSFLGTLEAISCTIDVNMVCLFFVLIVRFQ